MMIEKKTLDFLKSLSAHNNREWFNDNRKEYEAARRNVLDITMYLIGEIAKFDESVQGVGAEECLFRIYKDARFSRDKSPYKTNFGSFIKSGGRRIPGAGYYLHIEPGNSLLSGGVYMPPAPLLYSIRSIIAQKPEAFEKILNSREFKKEFGGLADETLKTAPKGFPRDHPAIEFLRYKHYYVMRNVDARELLAADFLHRCVNSFMIVSPFVRFLNS